MSSKICLLRAFFVKSLRCFTDRETLQTRLVLCCRFVYNSLVAVFDCLVYFLRYNRKNLFKLTIWLRISIIDLIDTLDKLVIGATRGSCSSFSQEHSTGAFLDWIIVGSAPGIWEFLFVSLNRCYVLVTSAAFDSVVREERHWLFTIYPKHLQYWLDRQENC